MHCQEKLGHLAVVKAVSGPVSLVPQVRERQRFVRGQFHAETDDLLPGHIKNGLAGCDYFRRQSVCKLQQVGQFGSAGRGRVVIDFDARILIFEDDRLAARTKHVAFTQVDPPVVKKDLHLTLPFLPGAFQGDTGSVVGKKFALAPDI